MAKRNRQANRYQNRMSASRTAYLIVVSGAILMAYIMASIHSNSGTASIFIRAVTPQLTPVRAFTVSFKGPISGLVHESDDGTLQLTNLPEGDYGFTIESPGYQVKHWQARVSSKTSGRPQLIPLKVANPPTPIAPIKFQSTPFQPIGFQTKDRLGHYERVRIKLYRNIDGKPIGDSQKAALIGQIFSAKPVTDVLRDPEWQLISETIITPESNTVSINGRTFPMVPFNPAAREIAVNWPEAGIYMVELSAAKPGQLFHPIRFPILISDTQIFRDADRRIHRVASRYGSPQPGTVYKAIASASGIQLIRLATIDQFNNAPLSVPDASFLVVSGSDNSINLLPNVDLRTPAPDETIWIHFPVGHGVGVWGLDYTSKNGIPTLTPHPSPPPAAVQTLANQMASASLIHNAPIRATDNQLVTGPIQVIFSKRNYQPDDWVSFTMRSTRPTWAFIEYPVAFGRGAEWVRVDGAFTIQRKWNSNHPVPRPLSVRTLTNGINHQMVIPIPTARQATQSMAPSIQVPVAKITPDQPVTVTINLHHLPPNSVGTLLIFAGYSKKNTVVKPALADRLGQSINRQGSVPLNFTPVKRWILPIQSETVINVPPTQATGNWVVYAVVLANSHPPADQVLTVPIVPSVELTSQLPTLARPNDILQLPITLRNHGRSAVSGNLEVWHNGTRIYQTQLSVSADQSIHRTHPIPIPGYPQPGTASVKIVWRGQRVLTWTGRYRIAPIILPQIVDRYGMLLVTSETPSASVQHWIKSGSQLMWASSHHAVIRYIAMKRKIDATFLTPDAVVSQRYEAAALRQSLKSDEWGAVIISQLNALVQRLDAAKKAIPIDSLSPAGLATLALSTPNNPHLISALSATLEGPISPLEHGIVMGVLAEQLATQYPDYVKDLLGHAPTQDPTFIHGFNLTNPDVLIGAARHTIAELSDSPPTANASIEVLETGQTIKRLFPGKRRSLILQADTDWRADLTVGLAQRITLPNDAKKITVSVNKDEPVVLFKKIVVPNQGLALRSMWQGDRYPVLRIQVPASSTPQQIILPQLTGLTVKSVLIKGVRINHNTHQDWVGVLLPAHPAPQTMQVNFARDIAVKRVQSAGWIQTDTSRQIFIIPGVNHGGSRP